MKCLRCNGSGLEPDHGAIGSQMRERRLAAELSLRTMGSLVGKSHCFLSQLESGKRRWTQALLDKYHRVIKEQDK